MTAAVFVHTRAPYAVKVYFDGGCINNPHGRGAGGAVVRDSEGRLLRHVGQSIAVGKASNNFSEWTGLIIGLQAALELGATHVEVFGDSELVIKQCRGEYAVRAENLRPLALQAARIRRQFDDIRFFHHLRKHNKDADSICTAVLHDAYNKDAQSIDDAVGRVATATGFVDVSVVFSCTATMDPSLVRASRARGVTDDATRERFIAEVERRLLKVAQRVSIAERPAQASGEVSESFTCEATMDAESIETARARGVSVPALRQQFAIDVDRRLTMAGQLGHVSIKPKRR
jgi:ribonuclease HI